MRRPRTLAALAFGLLALAVTVPSASATDPFPLNGAMIMSNANFTLHFNGNDRDTPCENFRAQPTLVIKSTVSRSDAIGF